MNTLHAGLMCTLLLVGTIAGLFGCMSAVRCHRRFAFAICLAITLLDFVPLAVLLSNLPTDETLCPIPVSYTHLDVYKRQNSPDLSNLLFYKNFGLLMKKVVSLLPPKHSHPRATR